VPQVARRLAAPARDPGLPAADGHLGTADRDKPTHEFDASVRADGESYFAAAVAMYTEEVGVSPLDGTNGYRWYVDRLLETGCAMGIVENGEVIFKSDVGSSTSNTCQVAGVWLRP
jgi:hypothetical protein